MHWPVQPLTFEPGFRMPDSLNDPLYFVLKDEQIMVAREQRPWAPLADDDFRWLDVNPMEKHYLGHLNGRDCVAVDVDPDSPSQEGYAFLGLRQILGQTEPELFYLAGRALQVCEWDRNHQFCGGCGEPTQNHGNERSKVCEDCEITVYPRLSPSIIVLVHRENRILLARNANWPNGFYSTLAGFVEPGESIEQCVHREVFEEVGIKVKNLKYLGSQSWPFPNSLMIGFHAEYDSGEFVFHDQEISDAQWFDVTDLPNMPGPVAISLWLIDDYVNNYT